MGDFVVASVTLIEAKKRIPNFLKLKSKDSFEETKEAKQTEDWISLNDILKLSHTVAPDRSLRAKGSEQMVPHSCYRPM